MRLCILITIILYSITAHTQYKKTYTVTIDTFENGKIFLYQTVRKKQTKEFKLHEFYLKQDVRTTLFYSNGSKWMEVRRVTKKGTYGRYCNEIRYELKEYYPNGQLKRKEINSCDCYRSRVLNYNKQGKRTSTERTKNRWIKKRID